VAAVHPWGGLHLAERIQMATRKPLDLLSCGPQVGYPETGWIQKLELLDIWHRPSCPPRNFIAIVTMDFPIHSIYSTFDVDSNIIGI
jgi:hypothetical protein